MNIYIYVYIYVFIYINTYLKKKDKHGTSVNQLYPIWVDLNEHGVYLPKWFFQRGHDDIKFWHDRGET